MLKKYFLFVSIFMQGLYGAAQENSTFKFKIAGYDNDITVENYHNYQTLENMFDDLGIDELATERPTFNWPPFMTPEAIYYLEEIVRCNTAQELDDALDKIYSGYTTNYYSQRRKNAKELLSILLAAQLMEIKNPLFNFETITLDQKRLTAINNLPLNFLSLVIARCMNIYGESIIKKEFMGEYQAYIADQNLTNKPLLSFIQEYEDALRQFSDGTGDTCFLSTGNIFTTLNNFLKQVNSGGYSYVHNGNDLKYTTPYEMMDDSQKAGKELTRYATLATATNTVLILTRDHDRHSPDRLDLLDLSTNRITPVYEETKPVYKGERSNFIINATISPTGKYVLIAIRIPTYAGNGMWTKKNKLVICENKEGLYLPIIEYFIDEDFRIYEAWYSQIIQMNGGYNTLQAISLPKYNPVFLQFNENEDRFFIIDSNLDKLSVFRINNKNLTKISTLHRGIAQAAQWIDDVNLLVDYTSYSHEGNRIVHTHYYFNTETNHLSDPLITNTSTDEFISFCLSMETTPTHIQYNTKDNYYLIRDGNDQSPQTPAFKIYKRFMPFYIRSLPFIDQLFLSICVENHGCPIDDRLMHQHYFSFITERYNNPLYIIDDERPNITVDAKSPLSEGSQETKDSKLKTFIKEEWNGVKDFFHRHSPRKFGKIGL